MLGLTLPNLISRIITLLIAFTIHELAHAVTAVQLGDDTPRRMGRMTLNPLAHLDPLGSLLLIFAGFGWAKPVQVNPYNLRNGPQMGMAVVSAAGPISNFIMAALAAIPVRLDIVPRIGGGEIFPSVAGFLQDFIFLNLILMLFNLIPITPLDGSKILRGFAPREWDRPLAALEQWGPFLLMALVFLGGPVMSILIGQPALSIYRVLVGL
ncbi:MAG: site-2 protease family protein [Anaerolineales bacterium]|nr:site-2 protease family protein [Anaerolineales bacterium]